jgi:hypothetical protein
MEIGKQGKESGSLELVEWPMFALSGCLCRPAIARKSTEKAGMMILGLSK